MRNLKNLLAAIAMVSVSVAAQAQTAKINGAVAGSQKPVEAASVGILRAKDSAIVKMAVTDKTGQFEVENCQRVNTSYSYSLWGIINITALYSTWPMVSHIPFSPLHLPIFQKNWKG